MKPRVIHEWPRRISDCVRIQKEILAPALDLYGGAPDSGLVLGIETATLEPARRMFCAAVLMRYPGFTEVERNEGEDDTPFPYRVEVDSFRQGKLIVKTLEKISARPDLIVVHGDGISNPSGIGVASHLGILYEIPAIGCSRRLRHLEKPKVPKPKGSQAKLTADGKDVAVALRSKEGTKPIFISPGYKISLEESVQRVVSMLRGFRTPEPIRAPHLLVSRMRSAERKSLRSAQYH